MKNNNGEDRKCQCCNKDGNTAHDLTWNENADAWLCESCDSVRNQLDDLISDYHASRGE